MDFCPLYQVDDPPLVEAEADRSRGNAALNYNIGAEENAGKTLDEIQGTILGSEGNYISDELLRKFESHNSSFEGPKDSLDKSVIPEKRCLVRTNFVNVTVKTCDAEEQKQNSFQNEAIERVELERNESVSILPSEKQIPDSTSNEISNMNAHLSSYVDSCSISRNWDDSPEVKNNSTNEENVDALFSSAETLSAGANNISGERISSCDDESESFEESGVILSQSNVPLLGSLKDETQVNQCFDNEGETTLLYNVNENINAGNIDVDETNTELQKSQPLELVDSDSINDDKQGEPVHFVESEKEVENLEGEKEMTNIEKNPLNDLINVCRRSQDSDQEHEVQSTGLVLEKNLDNYENPSPDEANDLKGEILPRKISDETVLEVIKSGDEMVCMEEDNNGNELLNEKSLLPKEVNSPMGSCTINSLTEVHHLKEEKRLYQKDTGIEENVPSLVNKSKFLKNEQIQGHNDEGERPSGEVCEAVGETNDLEREKLDLTAVNEYGEEETCDVHQEGVEDSEKQDVDSLDSDGADPLELVGEEDKLNCVDDEHVQEENQISGENLDLNEERTLLFVDMTSDEVKGGEGEGPESQYAGEMQQLSTMNDTTSSVSGVDEKQEGDPLSIGEASKHHNVEGSVGNYVQQYQQENRAVLEDSELSVETANENKLLERYGTENHVLPGSASQTGMNDHATLLAKDLIFATNPVHVYSARKPLTKEEVQFIKMGQIKACSVEMEKMKPELIKAYTFGRIRIRGSSFKLASHIGSESSSNSKRALTFSTRVKIMGKLERGVSIEALSHEYGINKSTLKTLRRLKNEKIRERQNSSESSASQEGSDSPVKEKKDISICPESGPLKKVKKVFKKPKCTLSVLMAMILQNTETRSLSYIQLKKLLCYLFPSYCKELGGKMWGKKLSIAAVKRAKGYFLKSRVGGKRDPFYLALNPEEEENWKKYVREGTRNLRNEAERVMRRPELLESLLLGIMRLDAWKITDEEIQADSDEESNSMCTSEKLQAASVVKTVSNQSFNGSESDPSSLLALSSINNVKTETVEKTNITKRKSNSSVNKPSKFIKTAKAEGSTDTNQLSNAVSKPGLGLGICDTFVNNRLVNLLMGKEKRQSEKSKDVAKMSRSSLVQDNSGNFSSEVSKENIKKGDVPFKRELKSSEHMMIDATTRNSPKQSDSKFQEAHSLGHSSAGDKPQQESCSSLRESKIPQVKLEDSPRDERSSSPANDEENLPRIISVEDRAYHMWQHKDQDDSKDMHKDQDYYKDMKWETDSLQTKKKSSKTFGKSVLSLVKKSGPKSKRPEQLESAYSHDQQVIGPGDLNRINLAATSVPGSTCVQSTPGIVRVPHSQQGQSGPSYLQSSQIVQSHSQPQFKQSLSASPDSQTKCEIFQPIQNPCRDDRYSLSSRSTSVDFESLQNRLHMPQSLAGNISSPNIPASMGTHFGINNQGIQPGHAIAPQENLFSNPGIANMRNWSSAQVHPTQSKQGKQGEERPSLPKVSECIETWQKVFPWMYYVEHERAFICSICEWSSSDRNDIEVFRLQTPKDVYLVAGQLRYHKETSMHRVVAFKREKVVELFDYVYPVLKGHLQEISGVEDIIRTVSDLAGGTFPGPQQSPQKEYFISYMIKHIAECIEDKLFESLSESPFFSVIAVKDKDYAIIRWLNNRGESEEHFFCSQIGYPGQAMSCLTYLRKRNVNMSKLISYTSLSNLIETTIDSSVMLQVPVRYPPLSVCLEWLDKASFLKNLFQHLSVLTRLCKASYHKFAQFPEASELMNMTEPYSHNCIVNSRIVNFFFGNIKVLRKISQDIYKTTGNMEAFGFSVLELQDYDSLLRCSSLLTKLHSIMSTKHTDPQSLCQLMKEFRSQICQRLPELKHENLNEYNVMSLIDIFLSHVMLTLLSPGKEITDIFSKNMRHLSSADLEMISPNLMSEYQGNSSQYLAKLHSLGKQLGESHDSSLLHLLSIIVSKQDLAQMYPDLYRLYQKITVLPFLHAHVEQSMFSVAAAEVFLTNKVEKRLLLPVTLILLEGPPAELMDKNHILDSWSRKWKICKLHKDM
ncbi:uncharacterized protein LOC135225198 isoform X2 [Macrobrachium nipponense]|uniref:uncharacterized protein LOC135225198 isoform X2 n=1 Tax=Macrobrachium nipponense TaxID=159736 RepID=UPI0030C80670